MINEIMKEKIIMRDYYFNKISGFLETPIIKVLTWMRRVWKSSILKSIIQKFVNEWKISPENVFYVNKELIDFDWIKDYHDLYDYFQRFLDTTNNESRIFIWVDEVQDIDWWERFINWCLAKYNSDVEIFVTWSNSTMLSSDLSTFLTWRYVEFQIFPLSFDEYSIFAGKEKDNELFLEYLKFWGLPGLFTIKSDDVNIFNYLSDIYSTIIFKDVVKHFWVRNIDFLENLYKYTFSNIWNVVSAKNISDYLKSQNIKISTEVVLNYLSFWTKVFLLSQAKSENPETKKYFEIFNKYYGMDLWLRNAVVWYNPKKDMWKLIENYVYLQLMRLWYNVKIWRLKWWHEIDFVAEKHGNIKYFQVALSILDDNTRNREYRSLESIKDNWPKYVVTMDNMDFWISDGIQHIQVQNFEDLISK